jgi:hypothetical protein
MQRSTGITVTAVLAFVGSGFALLAAFGVALVSVILPASRAAYGPPRTVLLIGVIYYLAVAAWGISTGVGLLKLREWARISELIFSALLVLGVGAGVAVLFIPFPTTPNDANPALTAHVMSFTRIGMAAFYGLLAVLGAWWLYYFNQSSIRAQFRAPQVPAVALTATALPAFGVPPAPPLGSFVLPPPADTPARPVSISIIAVLLLFGAAMMPLSLLFRTPLLFFGFLLSGWRGYLLALALSATNLAAGVGLFKLKLWARTLAICATIFNILNVTFTVLLPGSQSRWDQLMQSTYEKWGLPSNIPVPHFPLWLTMLPGIPFALIELYFLITRKPAFLPQTEPRL